MTTANAAANLRVGFARSFLSAVESRAPGDALHALATYKAVGSISLRETSSTLLDVSPLGLAVISSGQSKDWNAVIDELLQRGASPLEPVAKRRQAAAKVAAEKVSEPLLARCAFAASNACTPMMEALHTPATASIPLLASYGASFPSAIDGLPPPHMYLRNLLNHGDVKAGRTPPMFAETIETFSRHSLSPYQRDWWGLSAVEIAHALPLPCYIAMKDRLDAGAVERSHIFAEIAIGDGATPKGVARLSDVRFTPPSQLAQISPGALLEGNSRFAAAHAEIMRSATRVVPRFTYDGKEIMPVHADDQFTYHEKHGARLLRDDGLRIVRRRQVEDDVTSFAVLGPTLRLEDLPERQKAWCRNIADHAIHFGKTCFALGRPAIASAAAKYVASLSSIVPAGVAIVAPEPNVPKQRDMAHAARAKRSISAEIAGVG